jgi:hypothetical protein
MAWFDVSGLLGMAALPGKGGGGKAPTPTPSTKSGSGSTTVVTGSRSPTAPRVDLSREIKGFVHTAQWTCSCGAQLRIRARDDRASGPSNYKGDFPSGPLIGQDIVPHHELNWNGLAHKNGWKTAPNVPAQCPACQRGWTLADYKKKVRDIRSSRDAIVLQFSGIPKFSPDERKRYQGLIGPIDAMLERLRRVKED